MLSLEGPTYRQCGTGGEEAHLPTATNQQTATGYIGPVLYEDLIAANRDETVDPRSAQILEREKTYIQHWRRTTNAGGAPREIDKTLAGLALSGGGIRSATFALAACRREKAMAHYNALRLVRSRPFA